MQPEDFGITIPAGFREKDFREGFAHGMQSNTLTIVRKSYAEGFRTAKLLCRKLRKQQGIIEIPVQGKMKFRMVDKDDKKL